MIQQLAGIVELIYLSPFSFASPSFDGFAYIFFSLVDIL